MSENDIQRSLHLLCAFLTIQLFAYPAPQQAPQSPTTLKVSSTLVPVRVVVRDSKGRTVAGLKKDDFQILDEGKLQPISQFFGFSQTAAPSEPPAQSASHPPSESRPASTPARDPGSIYTVYLFDDIHIEREDFAPARNAAVRHVATLPPSEYAALVTTSGQTGLDFTLEHDKLRQSLLRLTPQDRLGDCLKLTYYQGNEIENEQNEASFNGAVSMAITCGAPTPAMGAHPAEAAAASAAKEAVDVGRADTARSLFVLQRLIRRMSKAPGQRNIILISNGIFFEHGQAESEVIDLAVRGNVTVNALDPAGMQPFDSGDSGQPSQQPGDEVTGATAQQSNQNANWALLKDLTLASGGIFFRGNNDLDAGFRRVAGAPESSYLLAFTPDPANKPGQFHKLKVRVAGKSLKVQARTGYFVPSK